MSDKERTEKHKKDMIDAQVPEAITGHRSETAISIQDECESGATISRLARVVSKEEPMHRMLNVIQRDGGSFPRLELVQIIKRWRYRKTLIDQALYLGLISLTKESESDNRSFYELTEKGSKVLEVCEKL